ncbi:hypothetical protein EVAR_50732_1 [Eumeta japonica]|uniref:Uncharacterized protein n=1 Tax=Eumeta variegata TaxID=151549 RepID=A0A4C1YLH1_EUMVA|nr:hypothetical protein EVAR_50732_1 [Eumeta japonica]
MNISNFYCGKFISTTNSEGAEQSSIPERLTPPSAALGRLPSSVSKSTSQTTCERATPMTCDGVATGEVHEPNESIQSEELSAHTPRLRLEAL